MSGQLIDNIEFRAVAPKTSLPGLDEPLKKLHAISAALDSVNRKLSGLSTHSAFTRTAAGIEEALKSLEKARGKGLKMTDASKALGFDPKDVRAYFIREQEKLTQAVAAAEKKRSSLRGAANDSARRELLAKEKKLQSDLAA